MIANNQRTKIIATVGPATNSYNMLLELVKAGVDVFRFNFSHGTHEEYEVLFSYVKKINRAYMLNVGILTDLSGPKMRIGEVEPNVKLQDGQTVKLVTQKCISSAEKIYINYKHFLEDVKTGDHVLINDGKIRLEVIEKNEKAAIARVLDGGELSSRKGVNLPNTRISTPSLTEKDKKDLKFALDQGTNWVALSFVRSAEDIQELKSLIGKKHESVKIIAKIEKPEAVECMDSIIAATDAVMIARGDLGVEMPIETVPIIQKKIVNRCIKQSKPVVIATQILETMIQNASPTRAEINDIANGVLDGADALMLSGETSVGKYPVRVVKTLAKAISHVEEHDVIYNKDLIASPESDTFLSDAICYNACKIAAEVKASAIIGMTRSGYTAFKLSSYRPKAKIFIFTDNEELLNTLSIIWGVEALYYDVFESTDGTITDLMNILKVKKHIKEKDIIINTASMPLQHQGRTNMVKVSVVD